MSGIIELIEKVGQDEGDTMEIKEAEPYSGESTNETQQPSNNYSETKISAIDSTFKQGYSSNLNLARKHDVPSILSPLEFE